MWLHNRRNNRHGQDEVSGARHDRGGVPYAHGQQETTDPPPEVLELSRDVDRG
jgi:hypothetical protein